MYKDWDTNPERFKRKPFPAWAFETIKFLYEQRGVIATGHEAMDTDTTDKMESETWHSPARALSDRGDGQSRPGAGQRRADRGELAESARRPRLPGARLCDFAVSVEMTNRLAGATSPYLLQHAHNPVAWWQWGPEALATAKREGKPILLVGRLRRLPLVPRDGAREFRGRDKPQK